VRYDLRAATISVRLADGSAMRLPVDDPEILLSARALTLPLLRAPGMHPAVPLDTVPMMVLVGTATLSAAQRWALHSPIVHLALDGQVLATRALASGSMPLTVGSVLRTAGRRVRITSVSGNDAEPRITIRSTYVGEQVRVDGALGSSWRTTTSYALANASRDELRELAQPSSSATFDALVLPGVHVQQATSKLEGRRLPSRAGVVGTLRDDRLVIVSHVAMGAYHLHLELPPPG
jgi:hypothetical protein